VKLLFSSLRSEIVSFLLFNSIYYASSLLFENFWFILKFSPQWGTGYDNEKLTCQESFLASFDRKETLVLFWCSLSNILNEIEMLTLYGRLVKMNKLSFPRVCNQNCLYWKLLKILFVCIWWDIIFTLFQYLEFYSFSYDSYLS
jgi:hypothetical protein